MSPHGPYRDDLTRPPAGGPTKSRSSLVQLPLKLCPFSFQTFSFSPPIPTAVSYQHTSDRRISCSLCSPPPPHRISFQPTSSPLHHAASLMLPPSCYLSHATIFFHTPALLGSSSAETGGLRPALSRHPTPIAEQGHAARPRLHSTRRRPADPPPPTTTTADPPVHPPAHPQN